MWMIPESLKIFIATSPTDMRKSFDGLSNLVYSVIEMDPLSGHLFVFFNRSRDRIKILWWHNGGFNLFCRRLERGRFSSSQLFSTGSAARSVTGMELAMILEGIDWKSVKKRPRWVPKSRVF
jgi:transposase